MKKTFILEDLDCAHCAAKIEEAVGKLDQAKATAHFAGSLPTLLIPTSIATCAAFAPLASCIQRMAHPLAAFATIIR